MGRIRRIEPVQAFGSINREGQYPSKETTSKRGDARENAALFGGASDETDGKTALVCEAARLIVEEALEGAVGDVRGRGYDEHGAPAGR